MELGTRLDLNPFVECHLYRTWPRFHICVFGQIDFSSIKTYLIVVVPGPFRARGNYPPPSNRA